VPVGGLDALFRVGLRAFITRLHLAQHATTLYVTHDQVEAMAMSDRIVVMSNAVVQQVGTPAEVYHNPANLFVARFIGSPGMNLIPGTYADGAIQLPGNNRYPAPDAWKSALPPGEVIVGFRPEAVVLSDSGPIAARVYATDLHGAYTMLHLAVGDEDLVVHARAGRQLDYPIDTPVRFDLDPQQVRFFDPTTEMAIRRQ
jgi:ABC-type sugar transport system ATPase subunit